MATIRKKGDYYYARFYNANGKQVERTTRCKKVREAKKRAEELESIANGSISNNRLLEVVTELQESNQNKFTIQEIADKWISFKSASVKQTTLDAYKGSIKRFSNYFRQGMDRPANLLLSSHIEGWRDEMLQSVSITTANNSVKCIKLMLKFASDRGFIIVNPAKNIQAIKNTRRQERQPFSLDEIKSILAHCNDEWTSMVMLGVYTGQRLGDLASLQWANINLETKMIKIRTRKTGKRLTIPICNPLYQHLISYHALMSPQANDYVHSTLKQRMMSRNDKVSGLSNSFANILTNAGLRERYDWRTSKRNTTNRKHHSLSFHSLRHTAVTLLYEAGVPQAVVMELIGHSSEAMSQLYTHVGEKSLRDAASKFPSL